MLDERYNDGSYLLKNRTWDVEDSPWKVKRIIELINKNNISPKSIVDIGCGAGEIIKLIWRHYNC